MINSLLTQFAAACQAKGIPFLPPWYKYLEGTTDSTGKCSVEFDPTQDLNRILLAVFEIVLFVGGIVAVVFIIYGGFQYLISQGEPERAKNARTTVVNAIVGLVIVSLATAIVNLIGRNIT